MGRFFLRFFLILIAIVVSAIIFLSYFGIETEKFDHLIKKKANEVNKYVKLDFNKVKIHLNISKFDLIVKLQDPKLLVKNNEIDLSRLDLFLSLKSFYSSDFLLKKTNIGFEKNDIKDLTKITSIFLPKIVNKQLDKVFISGNLEGEFIIPFEANGNIGKDYGFTGKILKAQINLTKEFSIKNLTAEINHGIDVKNNGFETIIKNGYFFDLELKDTTINLLRTENETKIKSVLHTKGQLSFLQIKKISSLLGLNISNFNDINGNVNLKTNINFDINKNFKIKKLSYDIAGNLAHLEAHTDEKKIIRQYLPQHDPKITIKDANIKLNNSKSHQIAEISGLIKINDHFDSFKIKQEYNYDKKAYDINGFMDLTNSKVRVSKLNYNKDNGKKSELTFNINFVLDKYYNIENLTLLSDKSKIYLSDVKLNKNFETTDFNKIEIITFSNGVKNNDFLVNKSDRILISGEVFDAEPLLKSLYKKSDRKTFSKKFNSEVKINFDKTLTGTNDVVSNFSMIASIDGGSYNKLSLKGNFSKNEIIEMSIYQIDSDKKTLQVISDRARPFIKNFDFIKGFEGGKLEYESVILKEGSTSNLLITDFKVSKVPALAKLLTLASLQGIADTLSGEGIRFDSFEMKSNSKGNILNIEDALAMGPAVSILLEGYVDKGKVVSLRGTLVPATKLNSIIASIPLVGDILVGKKTGEGVVGVSFKMKGPPRDIKTTVNPIKTLTPRFIVRTVEKIKKKRKEKENTK